MSSRTYLSIGDVLTLLRQEFPDVTISKIRFLESQGLVNPERTPSGYRKFYEQDVERLRWVLRQQREHFLPLKVIKGRLEQEVADDHGDDNGHEVGRAGTGLSDRHEPVLVGTKRTSGAPRDARTELPGFETGAETTPRRADAGRARPAHPAATSDPTPRRAAPAPTGAPAAPATSPATRSRGPAGTPGPASTTRTVAAGAAGSPGPSGGPVRRAATKDLSMPDPGTAKTPGGRAPAPQGGTRLGAFGLAHAERDVSPAAERDEPAVRTMSGVSMTLEELAAGSGLDATAVEELESYGLLSGRVVGGVSYYDEDCLKVARLAAGLARYGVEARHLRLHKHAAEREAGFIEQIVLPLLKQRNPEARQRAHEAVAELTVLGQGLREVLLRSRLRDQLGG